MTAKSARAQRIHIKESISVGIAWTRSPSKNVRGGTVATSLATGRTTNEIHPRPNT